MYRASMYGHHLQQSNMDQPRKVAMVSSTEKLSVLADAPVVSTYICTGTVLLFVFVYIPGIILGGGHAGRPGSSEVPRKLLTRWDVSSIHVNGIFLAKK